MTAEVVTAVFEDQRAIVCLGVVLIMTVLLVAWSVKTSYVASAADLADLQSETIIITPITTPSPPTTTVTTSSSEPPSPADSSPKAALFTNPFEKNPLHRLRNPSLEVRRGSLDVRKGSVFSIATSNASHPDDHPTDGERRPSLTRRASDTVAQLGGVGHQFVSTWLRDGNRPWNSTRCLEADVE